MDYEEFIKNISFNIIKPNYVLPKGYLRLKKILRYIDFTIALEILNTKLPENDRNLKKKLMKLCMIPRMSTFAIGAIINKCVACMPDDQVFVNIGVYYGFTYLAGIINNPNKQCVAVDNFSQFGGPKEAFLKQFDKVKSSKHIFYNLDYVKYFKHDHRGSIGLYIYDGEHTYEQQLNGLRIAEPFFSKNCVVIVDDTNWDEPRQATLDFISNSVNDYEILLDKKTYRPGHPTFWNGIIIFRKKMK
jgi:hypothetical protein